MKKQLFILFLFLAFIVFGGCRNVSDKPETEREPETFITDVALTEKTDEPSSGTKGEDLPDLEVPEIKEEAPEFPFPPTPPQKPGTFPGLSAETERQIKLDYINFYLPEHLRTRYTVDNIYIRKYFGTYNGCVPVIITSSGSTYLTVNTFMTVAGMEFSWPDSNVTQVWNGQRSEGGSLFYRLDDAFDLGLLTEDDIKSIYELQYK